MKGVAYIEIVENDTSGITVSIARCVSCGWVGGDGFNDRQRTVKAAKRHGKTCPEFLQDEVAPELQNAIEQLQQS
jgi:hypothetical protein